MRLSVLAFAIPLVCGGCVVQGTPDGGLAIDPAVRVVRTAPTYTAMPPPPPVQNYVAPEPTDIPGPPVYAPHNSAQTAAMASQCTSAPCAQP